MPPRKGLVAAIAQVIVAELNDSVLLPLGCYFVNGVQTSFAAPCANYGCNPWLKMLTTVMHNCQPTPIALRFGLY